MANWFTKIAKQRQLNIGQAEALAGVDYLPFLLEKKCGMLSAGHLQVLRQFRTSVESQLKILQLALDATSVVLFWSDTLPEQLTTYAFSSKTRNLVATTFPSGSGVIGALKNLSEISLAPYQQNSPAIPYYNDSSSVGSFFARHLSTGENNQPGTSDYGVLCVDRVAQTDWSLVELTLINATAEQISNNLLLTRDLLFTDLERSTLQLVFDGLQKLNAALDMKSVFNAAAQALNLLIVTDLLAISINTGDRYEIKYAVGDDSHTIVNHQFTLDDSLIGQAVKYRTTLPETSVSTGHTQVINGLKIVNKYKSVLVVPLMLEDRPVSGVLIIAARDKREVSPNCRKMIEIIAAQVAIKIDLAHSHEQIQQMAITDSLTGIANRRAFQRGFTAMYERACRRRGSFSLIICDIDHFKRVNDTYGHPFGDQVIQQVASQLNEVIRSGDLAARIGGEEFAVLLEDTGLSGALDVAERLRKKVEKLSLVFQGEAVSVTISLGITEFPQDSDNQEKLFNYADQALYRAKQRGRNCTVCWGDMG